MHKKWQKIRLQNPRRTGRQLLGYLTDLAAFGLSAFVAFELRFDGTVPPQYLRLIGTAVCIWAAVSQLRLLLVQ